MPISMPPHHPDLLRAHHNLAGCLVAMDDHDAAVTHYRVAHEGRLATVGTAHRDTLNSAPGLSRALRGNGQLDEARTIAAESLVEARQSLGPSNPVTAALATLAEALGAEPSDVPGDDEAFAAAE